MRATEILDLAVERRGDEPAIFCRDVTLSYPEVRLRVDRLSHALIELGAGQGDRVALLHRNCHRAFETYFAALRAGMVLVPVNPRLSSSEIRCILDDSEAVLAIVEPGLFLSLVPVLKRLPRLRRVLWTGPVPPFEDPLFGDFEEAVASPLSAGAPFAAVEDEASAAHLHYTSGSTGIPKGVILTRRNLTAHLECVLGELGLDGPTSCRWPISRMPGPSGR
jgi:acyl-CoA synthetase (AMP-forming)/AMP-acid ligase II